MSPYSKNIAWHNTSFRAYADYMETAEFLKGIDILSEAASHYRVAIMCSEAVWWRCHRGLISDYMKSLGWHVYHIMGENKSVEHPYTSAASIVDGKLTYTIEK